MNTYQNIKCQLGQNVESFGKMLKSLPIDLGERVRLTQEVDRLCLNVNQFLLGVNPPENRIASLEQGLLQLDKLIIQLGENITRSEIPSFQSESFSDVDFCEAVSNASQKEIETFFKSDIQGLLQNPLTQASSNIQANFIKGVGEVLVVIDLIKRLIILLLQFFDPKGVFLELLKQIAKVLGVINALLRKFGLKGGSKTQATVPGMMGAGSTGSGNPLAGSSSDGNGALPIPTTPIPSEPVATQPDMVCDVVVYLLKATLNNVNVGKEFVFEFTTDNDANNAYRLPNKGFTGFTPDVLGRGLTLPLSSAVEIYSKTYSNCGKKSIPVKVVGVELDESFGFGTDDQGETTITFEGNCTVDGFRERKVAQVQINENNSVNNAKSILTFELGIFMRCRPKK